jgi:hypothetical protein
MIPKACQSISSLNDGFLLFHLVDASSEHPERWCDRHVHCFVFRKSSKRLNRA